MENGLEKEFKALGYEETTFQFNGNDERSFVYHYSDNSRIVIGDIGGKGEEFRVVFYDNNGKILENRNESLHSFKAVEAFHEDEVAGFDKVNLEAEDIIFRDLNEQSTVHDQIAVIKNLLETNHSEFEITEEMQSYFYKPCGVEFKPDKFTVCMGIAKEMIRNNVMDVNAPEYIRVALDAEKEKGVPVELDIELKAMGYWPKDISFNTAGEVEERAYVYQFSDGSMVMVQDISAADLPTERDQEFVVSFLDKDGRNIESKNAEPVGFDEFLAFHRAEIQGHEKVVMGVEECLNIELFDFQTATAQRHVIAINELLKMGYSVEAICNGYNNFHVSRGIEINLEEFDMNLKIAKTLIAEAVPNAERGEYIREVLVDMAIDKQEELQRKAEALAPGCFEDCVVKEALVSFPLDNELNGNEGYSITGFETDQGHKYLLFRESELVKASDGFADVAKKNESAEIEKLIQLARQELLIMDYDLSAVEEYQRRAGLKQEDKDIAKDMLGHEYSERDIKKAIAMYSKKRPSQSDKAAEFASKIILSAKREMKAAVEKENSHSR